MKAPVSPKTAPPSPELKIVGMWEEKSPFTGQTTGVYHEIYEATDYELNPIPH